MVIDALAPLLGVADIDRSIAFYTKVLPFQVAQRTEAGGKILWALLQCGPAKIMLGRSGRAGGDAGVVLYLYVASARDCHAALQAKGAAPGAVRLGSHGLEEFRLRDPDGYELAIASPALRIA